MLTFFQVAPAVMAGVAFYVGSYYLLMYLRLGTQQRVNLTFALTCMSIGMYDVFCMGLYTATSIVEGAFWLRAQFVATLAIATFFLWFIFDYLEYPKKRIKWGLSAYFTSVAILALFDQGGWILDMASPAMKIISLPPALQVVYYEVGSGPVKFATEMLIIAEMWFTFWIATQYYRSGHQKEARPLLWAQIGFFACATNDILVVSGIYQGLYLTEYAFICIIVFMTATLSSTVVDSLRRNRQLLEDAVKLSEMKTDLVTFATHELKTPLVPIVGWAEFLRSGLARGKKLEELMGPQEVESIANAAQRLTKIIETFLDMGHVESKAFALHKQPCQITDLVTTAIANVRLHAQGANIAIHNGVQGAQINCDQFRIEQVFTNVISNAIKYSPPGTRVRITSEMARGYYIISFHDQGAGFTPEDLEHIWRPFHRGIPAQNPGPIASHGIGLYLAKVIVDLHGGTICISSPGPGQGSTVTITLPLGPPGPGNPAGTGKIPKQCHARR